MKHTSHTLNQSCDQEHACMDSDVTTPSAFTTASTESSRAFITSCIIAAGNARDTSSVVSSNCVE
eukprot:3305844-Prorocentrum_lima.AAC.1